VILINKTSKNAIVEYLERRLWWNLEARSKIGVSSASGAARRGVFRPRIANLHRACCDGAANGSGHSLWKHAPGGDPLRPPCSPARRA